MSKSGITYVIFHNYARIKVDSYDSLLLEKMLTFHQSRQSVFNKNKDNYYQAALTTKIYF